MGCLNECEQGATLLSTAPCIVQGGGHCSPELATPTLESPPPSPTSSWVWTVPQPANVTTLLSSTPHQTCGLVINTLIVGEVSLISLWKHIICRLAWCCCSWPRAQCHQLPASPPSPASPVSGGQVTCAHTDTSITRPKLKIFARRKNICDKLTSEHFASSKEL